MFLKTVYAVSDGETWELPEASASQLVASGQFSYTKPTTAEAPEPKVNTRRRRRRVHSRVAVGGTP